MEKLLLVMAFIALSVGSLNAQTVVNLPSGNVAPFTVQSDTTYVGVAGSTVINCDDKTSGVGINGLNASNVTLQNIEVTSCHWGILSQSRGITWVLDNINAHNNYFGLEVGSWFDCSASTDWLVTNSHFDNNDASGFIATNLLGSVLRGNTFNDNCTCGDTSGYCWWCGGYRGDDLCLSENPAAPGNLYENNVASRNLIGAGIWLDTVVPGSVVRYNTWDDNHMGFMNEITSGTEAYGNTGRGNGDTVGNADAGACIWVERKPGPTYSEGGVGAPANNNNIHDNVCDGNYQFALLAQNGGGYENDRFMNNVFNNNTFINTINGPDIRFVYSGTTNQVMNNRIGPDRAYMIEAPAWGEYISLEQFNTLPGVTGNYIESTPPPTAF